MVSGVWESVQDSSDSTSRSEDLATESEVLQKITDYSTEELSHKVCTLQFLYDSEIVWSFQTRYQDCTLKSS